MVDMDRPMGRRDTPTGGDEVRGPIAVEMDHLVGRHPPDPRTGPLAEI
jgi:hypothetical protein